MTHREMFELEQINELTQSIIEAAMEVHRASGPGQEAADYQDLLGSALIERGLKNETIEPYTADDEKFPSKDSARGIYLIEDQVMIEVITIDQITQDHKDRLLSGLEQMGYHVGLLINFNVGSIEEGIKRLINY